MPSRQRLQVKIQAPAEQHGERDQCSEAGDGVHVLQAAYRVVLSPHRRDAPAGVLRQLLAGLLLQVCPPQCTCTWPARGLTSSLSVRGI